MNRQEYNKKICDYLLSNEEFTSKLESVDPDLTFINMLYLLIEDYPQQRFGQLVCNYMISDYRNPNPSATTLWLQEYLFPGNPDPFFEESHYTYYRLTGEVPEDIRKELDEKKGKKIYYKLDNGSTGIGVLSGVCVNPYHDEWNWKIDDKKLISTNIHIKLL